MAEQVQQDSTLSIIQNLLKKETEGRDAAQARQQIAQSNLNDVLMQPLPDVGPIDRMVSDYLVRYGSDPRKRSWDAAAQAIGGESGRSQSMAAAQLLRKQQAAEAEETMASGAIKGDDALLRGLIGGTRGLIAKQPSPEQLRTVYNEGRNEAAQIAKGYNFPSATAREDFIEQWANRSVQNYVRQFATQPTGPRGEEAPQGTPPQAPQGTPPQAPQGMQQGMPMPGQLPPTSPQQTAQRNIELIQAELKRPEIQADPTRQFILNQELQRAQSALGMPTQPPITPPTSPRMTPPARNIPQEKMLEKGNEGMAGAYVEDYKNVQQAAAAAQQQRTAFEQLRQLNPETNIFANTQQTIGGIFQALGQDPNSATIQNAVKTRNANLIISQLTNASLKAEKGVQTKTDEIRIANEFPKTTDFKQVFNFATKLGIERANRRLDEAAFYNNIAEANNGVPVKAGELWAKETANDPITQYLGGKLIFRSDYINAYQRKYPDLGPQAAIQSWRELEQDYTKRGGRK